MLTCSKLSTQQTELKNIDKTYKADVKSLKSLFENLEVQREMLRKSSSNRRIEYVRQPRIGHSDRIKEIKGELDALKRDCSTIENVC